VPVFLCASSAVTRAIGEQFHPQKVILFGSYAYGTPHADSDVDLLVIQPTRNRHGLRVRIRMALTAPFPMDLIVRTPNEVKRRLEEGDSFLTEIVSKGKVLYETADGGVGAEGRSRSPRHPPKQPRKTSPA
jgi:predicted nucleotidyltransferase